MDFLVDCSGSGNPPSRVFASLANGTVVLFEHSPCSNSEYQNAVALDEGIDNALAIEKGEWRESVVCSNYFCGLSSLAFKIFFLYDSLLVSPSPLHMQEIIGDEIVEIYC